MAEKLYSALVCLALICSCQGRSVSSEISEIPERVLKGVSTENVRLALENLECSWDRWITDVIIIIPKTFRFEIDNIQISGFNKTFLGEKAVLFGEGEILVKGHYILEDLVLPDKNFKFNGNGSVEFKLIQNYLIGELDYD